MSHRAIQIFFPTGTFKAGISRKIRLEYNQIFEFVHRNTSIQIYFNYSDKSTCDISDNKIFTLNNSFKSIQISTDIFQAPKKSETDF